MRGVWKFLFKKKKKTVSIFHLSIWHLSTPLPASLFHLVFSFQKWSSKTINNSWVRNCSIDMLRYPELRCIFYSADALRSCSVFVLKCNWWSCLRCIRLCILFSHVTCTVSGTAKRQLKHIKHWELHMLGFVKKFQVWGLSIHSSHYRILFIKNSKIPARIICFLGSSEQTKRMVHNCLNRSNKKKNLACSRRKPHFPVWLSVLIMGNQCVQTPCIQSIKNSYSITLGFYYLF